MKIAKKRRKEEKKGKSSWHTFIKKPNNSKIWRLNYNCTLCNIIYYITSSSSSSSSSSSIGNVGNVIQSNTIKNG